MGDDAQLMMLVIFGRYTVGRRQQEPVVLR